MSIETVLAAARIAVDYHRLGYLPNSEFDANMMIHLMDQLGATLDEYRSSGESVVSTPREHAYADK